MKYTLKDFSVEFGQPIFNLGLGFLLVQSQTIPNWVAWIITFFIVLFGVQAIVVFAYIANYWKHALANPDAVKPGGHANEGAKHIFDKTCIMVVGYRFKETFWFNVAASMVLLAGLYEHEMMFALVVEAIACVIVYSVSRSFLSHFSMYFKLVEGKELEDV